jgi:Spy/CpxP family protein refolding chaperone
MKRVVFAVAAAVFLVVIAVMQASPALADQKAPPAGVSQDRQTPPPPGVSPKDPAMDTPNMDGWRCPRCGAALPRHARGGKAQYGRPELGSGWGRHPEAQARGQGPKAERSRPGRYGRAGDDRCCAEGPARMHRHSGGPGPRGGFERPAPRAGFSGRGMRGGVDGKGGGIPAQRLLRNAEALKLTDEQIAALEKLSFETQKTMVDVRAEIDREHLELKNLLDSGSNDLSAVKAHLTAASQARAEMQAARIENLFESRKVLTEKQKKAIKEDFPRLGTLLD